MHLHFNTAEPPDTPEVNNRWLEQQLHTGENHQGQADEYNGEENLEKEKSGFKGEE